MIKRVLFLTLVLFNLFDVLVTREIIETMGSHNELNPLMLFLIKHQGIYSVLVFKLSILFIIVVLWRHIKVLYLTIPTIGYFILFLYQISNLSKIGGFGVLF